MIISDKYNFVYIAIPKCGTNTMESILTRYFDAFVLRPIHDTNIPDIHKGKTLFTNIRNPYRSAVSIWWAGSYSESPDIRNFFKDIFEQLTFCNFVRWIAKNGNRDDVYPVFNSQSYFLKNLKIDHFIRLEKLKKDLASMPFLPFSIVKNLEMPKLNCNTNRNNGYGDYCSYYRDNKTELYIREWAKDDFLWDDYKLN